MSTFTYHYIVDTKLIFYGCKQTGRDVLESINDIARTLISRPKGKVYVVADLGSSTHRLAISPYYKGKRREQMTKKSQAEQDAHKLFSEEYVKFIELLKNELPITVMDINDVEADDVASILAHTLSQDSHNRVGLITRDLDWLHSVINRDNVKIISPYPREEDKGPEYVRLMYNVSTREEFTLRKALYGDDGDSIINIRYLGKEKADIIWESCKMRGEVTLDILREEIHNFINKQKNPAVFKVPPKYVEYGVASTIDEVIDVNYRLGSTLMDISQLTPEQQKQYIAALKRPLPDKQFDAFNKGFEYFNRPIILTEAARKVFNGK